MGACVLRGVPPQKGVWLHKIFRYGSLKCSLFAWVEATDAIRIAIVSSFFQMRKLTRISRPGAWPERAYAVLRVQQCRVLATGALEVGVHGLTRVDDNCTCRRSCQVSETAIVAQYTENLSRELQVLRHGSTGPSRELKVPCQGSIVGPTM